MPISDCKTLLPCYFIEVETSLNPERRVLMFIYFEIYFERGNRRIFMFRAAVITIAGVEHAEIDSVFNEQELFLSINQ